MSFNITRLAGSRAIVEGTDTRGTSGSEVISTEEFDAWVGATTVNESHRVFDEAVEQFFAPLTEAAEALDEAHRQGPKLDPLTHIVEQEAEAYQPETPGQVRVVRELGRSAVILRAIDEGADNRLIWVNGSLEILEAEAEAEVEIKADVEVEVKNEQAPLTAAEVAPPFED